MKKNLMCIILAVCIFSNIGFLFTSCGGGAMDLSHKHYLNQYGFCSACQKDQAVRLERNEKGEYASERVKPEMYNDTFFKFSSNGENGIEISLQCEDCSIEEILLLSDDAAYITSAYAKETLIYDYPLTAGITYYVRVKLKDSGQGYLTMNVAPLN